MQYVTQDDIQSYLDVTLTGNGINLFNLLQQSMQDMVDQYCNRTWNFTNPVTENFDAMKAVGGTYYSNYDFFVSSPQISKTAADPNHPQAGGIISISVGNTAVDMSYVINYGSFIRISASFSSVLLANPLGFKGIQVQYNSDAATPTGEPDSNANVPAPVKMALIQWIARQLQNSKSAGKDPKEVMAGTIRKYYQEDKDGAIPDFVKRVLDTYRLTPIDRF